MKKLYLATMAAGLMASASAFAQTTPPAPSVPATPPATTTPQATPSAPSATTPSSTNSSMTLSDQQAKDWIDKVVYSSDGKNVGEVAAFARDTSGKVSELHIDVGGLMGIGETRVRLMPAQFRLEADRVTVALTESQIRALPQIAK